MISFVLISDLIKIFLFSSSAPYSKNKILISIHTCTHTITPSPFNGRTDRRRMNVRKAWKRWEKLTHIRAQFNIRFYECSCRWIHLRCTSFKSLPVRWEPKHSDSFDVIFVCCLLFFLFRSFYFRYAEYVNDSKHFNCCFSPSKTAAVFMNAVWAVRAATAHDIRWMRASVSALFFCQAAVWSK